MSGSPIFDQLQAEFVEQSKFIRLQIGPLIGEGFEKVEVVNEYFGTTGYVHRLIKTDDETLETVDEVTTITENVKETKPRLYIVDGAPELVNLDEVKDEDVTIYDDVIVGTPKLDDTMVIPRFKHEEPKPPSIASDETLLIPAVEEEHKEPTIAPEKPADDADHVVPLKKVKALHKTAHRKLSATGTFSWFNHRAA